MTTRYMALHEVADALGVDVQTVRRWIHGGKLRAFKPGKEYRVRAEDLDEFLQAHEAHPKAQALDLVDMFEEPSAEERRRALLAATDEERAAYLRELEAFAERTEALIAADEQAAEQHQGQRILARRLRALQAEAEATATLSEPVDATVAAQAREMLHAS